MSAQLIHIRSSVSYNAVNAQTPEGNMSISNSKNTVESVISPSLTPTTAPVITVQVPSPVLTVTSYSPTVVPTASVQAVSSGDGAIDALNTYRSTNGLSSVSFDSVVCGFAATRASEIVSDFSHNGFVSRRDGGSLPYSGYSNVVENIAMSGSGQSAIDMWKGSASHNANLLADITYGCIVANGNYVVFEGWKP